MVSSPYSETIWVGMRPLNFRFFLFSTFLFFLEFLFIFVVYKNPDTHRNNISSRFSHCFLTHAICASLIANVQLFVPRRILHSQYIELTIWNLVRVWMHSHWNRQSRMPVCSPQDGLSGSTGPRLASGLWGAPSSWFSLISIGFHWFLYFAR